MVVAWGLLTGDDEDASLTLELWNQLELTVSLAQNKLRTHVVGVRHPAALLNRLMR